MHSLINEVLSIDEQIDAAVEKIKSSIPESYYSPMIGIICGSGLSNLVSQLRDPHSIEYHKIPHFPTSTVTGHGNRLVVGYLNGILSICMMGRFHYYEGHPLDSTVFPVRVMARIGIKKLLITNAAGAIDPSFDVGDIMVIKDHISFLALAGLNPLRGPNNPKLGPRFPSLTDAYHHQSYPIVLESAKKAGIQESCIKSGVYINVGGPSYETPAEMRFLRIIGGGAVGMSTVPEVITAVHAGLEVVGISLITNIGIIDAENYSMIPRPTHEEVLAVTEKRSQDIENLVFHLAPLLDKL